MELIERMEAVRMEGFYPNGSIEPFTRYAEELNDRLDVLLGEHDIEGVRHKGAIYLWNETSKCPIIMEEASIPQAADIDAERQAS